MTEQEIIKRLHDDLNEVVNWVEANVAYGLPDDLLNQASEALRIAKESAKKHGAA
jgi:hypothetical protein